MGGFEEGYNFCLLLCFVAPSLHVCGVERRVLFIMNKCTSLIGGVSYKCIHIPCHGMNFSQVLNQCSKLCNDSDLHSIPFAL